MAPMPRRHAAWALLAQTLDHATLQGLSRTIGLADALDAAQAVLAGQVRGRLVVDVNA
jgi:acrylyl-CoA reductase (NADPH)